MRTWSPSCCTKPSNENTDGQGTFGAQQTITTAADGAISVLAAHVDGDGDLDALSASDFHDRIAW